MVPRPFDWRRALVWPIPEIRFAFDRLSFWSAWLRFEVLDRPPDLRVDFAIKTVLSELTIAGKYRIVLCLSQIGRRVPTPQRRDNGTFGSQQTGGQIKHGEDPQRMSEVEDVAKSAREPRSEPAVSPQLDRTSVKSHAPLIPLAAPDAESDTDQAEYTRLLAMYEGSFRNLSEGEVIKGTVLKVSSSEVVVDVGYKSEGVIALSEFIDENGDVTVRPGDTVDVLLERTEDREGHIVLSREKAEKMKIWDDVEQAYIDRKVVIGRVIERIKGGLAVDIGVRAFLPGSQIDVRPVRNLDSLRGQELRMRVIKVNKKRGNIVLSRKVLLEEENAEKKKDTLANLTEGKVIHGVVKNITDYGAFVDLGGIDGLLHVTDMSWGRAQHPLRAVQGQRRNRRDGPEVRSRNRAGLPGP